MVNHIASAAGEALVHVPGYSIRIAPGALSQAGAVARAVAPAHRYAIISDENVAPLYAGQIASQFPEGSCTTITIPAGESHKNRDSWATVTDHLLDSGFGRDSAAIALGGGVVGDLAGFVAATFMRGIPFIQVPTTLLAMIDASIGGKTGVDTAAGKNLVGAFHPPAAVIIDPHTLSTLSVPLLRAGLAEAVKHGVIADEEYFAFLQDAASRILHDDPAQRDSVYLFELIERSVRIKGDIVARDLHEKGIRKVLNFGHTIGHAIESLSGFTLSHGDAVAIGMVLESRAAEQSYIAQPGTTQQLVEVLEEIGLPTTRPSGPSPDEILAVMRGDKKSRAGQTEYALPARIGEMAGEASGFGVAMDDAVVRNVLA